MGMITTLEGLEIFYKDWGPASRSSLATAGLCRPTIGTPRCSSFSITGFRVIAHDRRVTGVRLRQPMVTTWITMPTTSQRLTAHLDLNDAIHVGHSTGGGEVARYIAKHGQDRVAKAVLISSVPPLMVKTESESRRPSQRGLRRTPGAGRHKPRAVLPRPTGGPVHGFNRTA